VGGSSFPSIEVYNKRIGFETKIQCRCGTNESWEIGENFAFAMSSVAATLAKFLDVCLYMSQNFDFISLPAHLTTGSSIMPPQEKPDVFELIRGKCNKIQALPYEITFTITFQVVPQDLQLLKEGLFPQFKT
jgi:argininosuccinate lyase